MVSGVRDIQIFDRVLSGAEMLAIWATLSSVALPDAMLADSPCNTGAYLSDKSAAGVDTPCGKRNSTLAPIGLPSRFQLRDASGYYWGMPNPGGRIITSPDSDSASTLTATPMGGNNFVLRNNRGWVVRQQGEMVVSSEATDKPAADQYWHIVTPDGGTAGQDLRLQSLGNGGFIGLSSDKLNVGPGGIVWRVHPAPGSTLVTASAPPLPHEPAEDRDADQP